MGKIYLYLEDGTVWEGEGFGFQGETVGEVVFSTGMTGYTESLTDPSFAGQILTFTYPMIGNYGVPKPVKKATHLMANFESERIWVKGVVVGSVADIPSHFASVKTFSDWLIESKVSGIAGVDTRALTQHIRDHGCMRGKISSKKEMPRWEPLPIDVVRQVSLSAVLSYEPQTPNGKHLALIDCGVKHGIIRELLHLGYRVTRVPWDMNPLDIEGIDGVVCSNGPGDPKDCGKTVENIRKVLDAGIPYLGVCLGHQLLSLAIGADTYKLPFGHRGINQPCLDVTTHKAYVTSQNHGYAVAVDSIPKDYQVWFTNLNDGTIEGIRHREKNIQSVQFHPEGYPGPHDTKWIFEFV